MQAVVHYALPPRSVELRDVPKPTELAADEVLLETRSVGVCGSEIHQYHNTQSWSVRLPVILGHEFAGVIAGVGKGAREFREGDRVTSETAAQICGRCVYCRSGEYHLCPERLGFGYGVDGGMADYVKVPARCLHRLPDTVSFDCAALTEPCCVAYNAVCVKTRIRPGDAVLVFGPGPMGLLCLELARLSGAGWVGIVGLERDRARLGVAPRLGANATVVAGQPGVLEVVRSVGDGLGVDAAIDATGVSGTLEVAMAAVRPGGQITKLGWGPQPIDFSLDPVVQKALRIQGSFSHHYRIWEKVLALFASGRLDPLSALARPRPLVEWRACFEEMASGAIVKGLLHPARAGDG